VTNLGIDVVPFVGHRRHRWATHGQLRTADERRTDQLDQKYLFDIYMHAPYRGWMTVDPESGNHQPGLPLSGVRVLDLSTFLAAPVAATLLGEFGAEVIKVEAPEIGDFPRWHASVRGGRSAQWAQEGRNKSSVTVNLRTAEGQQMARDLAGRCDVVVTNFRPSTAERWGLSPEDLVAVRHDLIVLSVTGYGLTGPYRDRGAFDRIASAFAGHTYVSGYPDRPPVRSGYATIDYLGAYAGAFGVMAALRARDRGHGGQIIDLALTEVALRASEGAASEFAVTGRVRERVGNRNPRIVPASESTASDGRNVAYHAGSGSLLPKLLNVIDRQDLLEDPRFSTPARRVEHQDALYQIISEWIAQRSSAEVVDLLNAGGVPASTVNNTADLLVDPHLQARGIFEVIDDPELGSIPVVAPVPRLTVTPAVVRHLGPGLGADTDEVLSAQLGLSSADIGKLRQRGVV
jgi:crotonobetainyl-CoA:carnitine CoA-transferase CaiB-like acyl-CoA transferase